MFAESDDLSLSAAMPAPGKRGFGQSEFDRVVLEWQVAQAKWKADEAQGFYKQILKAYNAQRSEGAKAAGKGKSSTKPQGGACFFGHLIYINDISTLSLG